MLGSILASHQVWESFLWDLKCYRQQTDYSTVLYLRGCISPESLWVSDGVMADLRSDSPAEAARASFPPQIHKLVV